MFRLLYIVSTLGRTGPTNQLFNIINGLDRSKFTPHLVTLSPEPESSRYAEFSRLAVHLHPLGLTRVGGLRHIRPKLRALIEDIGPDLIHSHGFRGDRLVRSLKGARPWVCTVHNVPQLDYAMTYGKAQGWLMTRMHVSAFRAMDLCIGVSGAVVRNLTAVLQVKKVAEIDNGIDQRSFYPLGASAKTVMRARLKLPTDEIIWVSSGNLSPLKDPRFLIEQWCTEGTPIARRHHLVLLGDGTQLAECRRLAALRKNVHIVGRVSNVGEYLQAADYFVSASHAEGLPMAALEGMACGLPALLSDIAPHAEMLSSCSAAGRLFKINSGASFMKEFHGLVAEAYECAAGAAVDVVHRRFDARAMSEAYQVRYRELLS